MDAIGLTNMVRRLNHGLDPGGNPSASRPGSGRCGRQPGRMNMDEIRRFEWKVEAGAEFVVTQPVFDPDQLERFLGADRARIPVLAAIWPLTSLRNAEFLVNEVPGRAGAGCGASSGCGEAQARGHEAAGRRRRDRARDGRGGTRWCKACR